MDDEAEARLEARYRHLFGRLAGYLPRDRAAVDRWQRQLADAFGALGAPKTKAEAHRPSVAALARLIETDGIVRMYVDHFTVEAPPPGGDPDGGPPIQVNARIAVAR